jgi:hypothetical protein
MSRLSRFALAAFILGGAFLLAAAPAASIDECGNNICRPDATPPETPENCPADCGGGPNDCLVDSCDQGSCSRPEQGVDRDFDGVPDSLEHDLAHKFFPAALLQWHGEDRSESYLYNSRATPFVVRPFVANFSLCDGPFECLEIRWAIAFFYDHGDTPLDLGEHVGDSEMYAGLVRLSPFWTGAPDDPEGWVLFRDLTASHLGTAADSSKVGAYGFCTDPCFHYSSDLRTCAARSSCAIGGVCWGQDGCESATTLPACQARACTWTPICGNAFPWACYDDWYKDERVTVFSAESKHALYHSDDECDGGGWHGSDDCPNNEYDLSLYKEGLLQNVGNADSHADFDTTIQHTSQCGSYNVWGGEPFGEASSYLQHFTSTINWALD